MKIECTVEELKELIKKEQTECKSECSMISIKLGSKELCNRAINHLTNRYKLQEDLT